ncbi:MAG: sulfatase [Planctomycetota bacterium]
MPSDDAEPDETRTLVAGLMTAAWAALIGSLLGALGDAGLAWWHFRSLPATAVDAVRVDGWGDLLGGVAGAATIHLPLQLAALVPLTLVAWPLGLRRASARRRRWLLASVAFSLALFPLAYWHTRELLFYGRPATSPERLASAAGLLLASLTLGAWMARRAAGGTTTARLAEGAAGALVVLAGVLYTTNAGSRAAERGAPNARNADLPNVILVVVDALRPDVLGCYGNERVRTPHIDALAANGVVFDQAYSNAPFTGTSFASFFTGQYPRRHGMLTMGPGVEIDAGMTFTELLDGALRTDGTPMRDGDIVAGSFMTGALSHGSGLMAGFDAYRELTLGHALVDLSNRWSVFRAELVPSILWSKVETKLDRDALIHAAERWLGDQADNRFALFVHLYSTHTPYDPPEPFRSDYVDPAYDGPIQAFYADMRVAIERADYTLTPADQRQIYDLYLGGVAQADHHIGLLVEELERQGRLDETLLIITSDHGEDFGAGANPDTGQPGRWEHNHMYRSNLHIPLVIHWPDGIPGGRRVSAPVEGVDLVPTVLDAAGLRAPELAGPRDVIDGQSLLPLARGETEGHKPFLFAEDATYVSIHDGQGMLTLERYAVAPDGWELVLEEGLGSVRFHDLAAHPSGEVDLFADVVRGANPSVASDANRERVLREVERLRTALLAWDANMPIGVETIAQSDRDLESLSNRDAAFSQQLAELGYVDGWDQYSGELRERVLERRESREREDP